ncbi:hypothetical protein P7C70_g2067, partial [Phenoliferia sp. Uapishka_3]
MATINSLSLEVLHLVLKNLLPISPYFRATIPYGLHQPSDLLATVQVCNSFRAISQELLGRYLDFTGPFHRTGLELYEDGEYSRHLQLYLRKSLADWLEGQALATLKVERLWVTETFVLEVLSKIRILKELELAGRVQGPCEDRDRDWQLWERSCIFREEVGWEVLAHPALRSKQSVSNFSKNLLMDCFSGLKRLSIQSSGYHRRTPHAIPPLEFRLEHLTLRTPGNPPPDLIESLFSPECSPSLRSLDFIFLKPGNVPHWTPSIIPDLRSLTHLSLSIGYPLPSSISALMRFCTSLIVLTLEDYLKPTSERLLLIGQSLPSTATITTIYLVDSKNPSISEELIGEQYKDFGEMLALPVMEKVKWVCAPAIDLQREWTHGMDFTQLDRALRGSRGSEARSLDL